MRRGSRSSCWPSYLVIDVWKVRRWSFFFRVIGMNSITIYLGTRMINDYEQVLVRRAGESFRGRPSSSRRGIAVEWLVLYFLYKKKVFLRV